MLLAEFCGRPFSVVQIWWTYCLMDFRWANPASEPKHRRRRKAKIIQDRGGAGRVFAMGGCPSRSEQYCVR
jgi:hypothetical protein